MADFNFISVRISKNIEFRKTQQKHEKYLSLTSAIFSRRASKYPILIKVNARKIQHIRINDQGYPSPTVVLSVPIKI
jgi:hypothetical protein